MSSTGFSSGSSSTLPFFDEHSYCSELEKSLPEKLFFIHHVSSSTFIEFGCARGALLSEIKKLFPSSRIIGIERHDQMRYFASNRLPSANFYSHYSESERISGGCLILSSVLHEVYSFLKSDEIKSFWNWVLEADFDEIVIREMGFWGDPNERSEPSNLEKVSMNASPERVSAFEKRFGSLEIRKNLIHFLLKSRYEKDFERELLEDYFAFSEKQIPAEILSVYEIHSRETAVPSYLFQSIKENFGVCINDATHLKMIFKRKEDL